jgi:6-phosphogluconolactonase (cycloisomerase 2 family)
MRSLAWTMTVLALGAICSCSGGSSTKVLYAIGNSPDVTIFAVSGSGIAAVDSVSTGSGPDAMGIDPGHRFAYIANSANGIGPGTVSQYLLDSKSGLLTPATFSSVGGSTGVAVPIQTGTNPTAVTVNNAGTFVFVANQGSDSISSFMIDQIGGTLTEVKFAPPPPVPPNCVLNNPEPCPLSIAPASPTGLTSSGNMLFVATSTAGAGAVSTYNFDLTTGLVATPPVSTTAVGLNPSAMIMDLSGKFLFLIDSSASEVAVVSIGSSGQLTPVGAPVATGPTPLSVAINPAGTLLYTANLGLTVGNSNCVNGGVSGFSVDGSGNLTPLTGSPFAVGPCPSSVTTDSSGGLLFVGNGNPNNTISMFSIGSGGALKQIGSAFPSVVVNPIALASIN